jgi:hypothetical protein
VQVITGEPDDRYGDQELLGSIDVDPAVRPPRRNGDRDVEVLIACCGIPADGLSAHLARCQNAAVLVLGHLPRIRRRVAAMAPPELAEAFGWPRRPLIKRLFLDGLDFDSAGQVTAAFDFGHLNQLTARADPLGKVTAVNLRA